MDFLKRMFAAVLTIFKLPDIADSVRLRRFIQGILEFAASMADRTSTQIDDLAVDSVLRLVNDDETWAAIHAWIVARLANEPGPELGAREGEFAAMLLGAYGETDVA